ncbi:FMN-dependent NADH-azoreductase [Marinimicrobium sp. ABcell2]|uniref:FMN-dependent NADH-azoreductase n=1 Tax=Marinimicrobium sp. ABcell2 TaxID=3069751 RepID=UPI0027B7D8B1|nr:NAD(P)H-dependent oxidoreductase [Marinimicrobium sp. ABcell2]MDQ2078362.1 NAD(P)H-dependent oxidoreductase [Marinimicrobium sp. ABcell2]
MTKLLQINSSLSGDDGYSSALTNRFVEQWLASHPKGTVKVRDLARHPVPHLDAARLHAFITPEEKRTEEQQEIVAYSDTLINELREADIIVIGVPMYNFGIPSTLKAYFDHVARSGETFRYTENGPEGLLDDKPVYLFAARGGLYEGTEADSQTGYLNTFLSFLGLHSTQFVYAEGMAMRGAKERALEKASAKIEQLAAA